MIPFSIIPKTLLSYPKTNELIFRIVPNLDTPFLGGSAEHDLDPFTTNVYICNLPLTVRDDFETSIKFHHFSCHDNLTLYLLLYYLISHRCVSILRAILGGNARYSRHIRLIWSSCIGEDFVSAYGRGEAPRSPLWICSVHVSFVISMAKAFCFLY